MPEENLFEKTFRELQALNQQRQTGEIETPEVEVQGNSNPAPQQTQQTPPPVPDYGYGPVANEIMQSWASGDVSTDRFEDLARPASRAGHGMSRYDRENPYEIGMDLQDMRAKEQSDFSKIGTGLSKMATTALGTFANTTVGTVYGALSAGGELINQLTDDQEGVSFRKILEAGVNNEVSEYIMDFQKQAEKWFPNYRTEQERSVEYQREWWKHLGTANFIGDVFLKNLGFTVGAIGGGAAWSRLLLQPLMRARAANSIMKGVVASAAGDEAATTAITDVVNAFRTGQISTIEAEKLLENVANAAKILNRMDARMQLYGAVIGAMGEGSAEGLMAKDEFLQDYKAKNDRKYYEEYQRLEDEILEEGLAPYVEYVPEVDSEMQTKWTRQLTDEGRQLLSWRRRELADKYNNYMNDANGEAERLASTVFMLNIPVLTASNVVQFGKMFSGGWKTARKNLASVAGQLGIEAGAPAKGLSYAAPKLAADYAAKGSKAAKALAKSGEVALSESSEEMIQGFVSSGAKYVADSTMAAYNNRGYDYEATRSVRDWVSNMFEGGMEYLEDPTNWQEGFLGALTGLLGMPSFSFKKGQWWSGGVIGSALEANNEMNASKEAADKLNELVNSNDFQTRWHNYIRGLAYSNDMDDALAKNDQYAWHNASDNRLINDIMTFADAGKLDDLRQLVDYYSGISEADAERMKSAMKTDKSLGGNSEIQNMSAKTIVSRIKDGADTITKAIDRYSEIYDALVARDNTGMSSERLKEVLFTAQQIKYFEDRFLNMLDETKSGLSNIFDMMKTTNAIGQKVNEGSDQELRLDELQRVFTSFHANNIIPGKMPKVMDALIKSDIEKLDKLVAEHGTPEQKQKVEDMRKLAADRKRFYEKLETLQGLNGEEKLQKEMKTQAKEQRKNNVKQIETEAVLYENIDDVKVGFRSIPPGSEEDRQAFFDVLNNEAEDNPAIEEFLKLYDAYNDFLESYKDSKYKVPEEFTAINAAISLIIPALFDKAQSEEQFIGFNIDLEQRLGQFGEELNPNAKEIKDQLRVIASDIIPERLNDIYARALSSVKNGMKEYAAKRNYVTPSNPAPKKRPKIETNPSPADTQMGQPGDGITFIQRRRVPQKPAAQPASPEPGAAQSPQVQNNGQKANDKFGREWTVGQKAYLYKPDQDGDVSPIEMAELTVDGFFDSAGKKQIKLSAAGKRSRYLFDLDSDDIARLSPSRLAESDSVKSEDIVVPSDKTTGGAPQAAMDSAASTPEFQSPEEKEEVKPEVLESNRGVVHYIRTGMPQISSFAHREARKIIDNPELDNATKLEKLSKLDMRPFYELDGNKSFTEISEALEDYHGQNAFENTALILERGDEIKFKIDPEFPVNPETGDIQILMFVEKDGVDYILNTLGSDTSTLTYENIRELRDTIIEKYNSSREKENGEIYTFSDEKGKPITSTVWAKRAGLVTYTPHSKKGNYDNEKRIGPLAHEGSEGADKTYGEVPGYDEKAPIVFIDKNGDGVLLSDDDERSDISIPENVKTTDRSGNLYYLAKGANGKYCVPIRLFVEHYRRANKDYSLPIFKKINTAIAEISKYANEAASATETLPDGSSQLKDIKKIRSELHAKTKDLAALLDLSGIVFGAVRDKDNVLHITIYRNEKSVGVRLASFSAARLTPELLSSTVASWGRSITFNKDTDAKMLIDSGVLTTNATTLYPKGTDFYAYRWSPEDGAFTKWGSQEALANRPGNNYAEEREQTPEEKASKEEKKETAREERKQLEPKPVAEEPIVPAVTRDDDIIPTPDSGNTPPPSGGKIGRWDIETLDDLVWFDEGDDEPKDWSTLTPEQKANRSLNDQEKKDLTDAGYDKETFNNGSAEFKENILSCLGVL